MTKNDLAWEGIVRELRLLDNIENNGYVTVTADQLRQWREPRLMVKMDQEQNRPKIFRDHGLNVLAVSDREFAIGKFDVFQELPKSNLSEIEIIPPPSEFETLKTEGLTSETQVLHAAFLSGMVSSVFGQKMFPTVSGKSSTAAFNYKVSAPNGSSSEIPVTGARIEIDAGFEGTNVFSVFEIKMNYLDNFNLRQLYYPFRLWSDRIRKNLVPMLLTHSNGVFTFFEVRFASHESISSAEVVSAKSFSFSSPFVPDITIENALRSDQNISTQGVPFPQADKFEKVIDLLEILSRTPRTQEEIATEFAFDSRQADYYFNAGKFLGLTETAGPSGRLRRLSELGKEIMSLPPGSRNSELVSLILDVPVFRQTLSNYIEARNGDILKIALSRLKDAADDYGLGATTIERRARTVASWCDWILALRR